MSNTRIMIVAAVLIVALSLVMVYLYGEHFASVDATATSQSDQNNSSTIQDY
jgi:preprotein translocase subunit SecG